MLELNRPGKARKTVETPTYEEFLAAKITLHHEHDIDLSAALLDPSLFPHQIDAIRWAFRCQRALIAMSFGLGKSRVAISIAKVLQAHTQQPFLIVCPLGVRHQFINEDGPALETTWKYIRTDDEWEEAGETPFLITNYERIRDGNIDPRKHALCGVNLDEGSVIRNLSSKTSDVFTEVFAHVPYRFICTATPSPNRFRELIYYADWLGVMDRAQALTR